MIRRLGLGLALAATGSAVLAASAPADHHFVKISEWYPGTAATADDSFLELQMYAAGQNEMAGHRIHVYGPGADATPANFQLSLIAPIPPNSENQRTVLIGGSSGPANRNYTENLDGAADFSPAGGALCFVSNEGFGTIDCVEWGSGNNTINEGTPVLAAGIPDGKSVSRSITPNCPTSLDGADDSGSSASDFSQTDPSPRGNTDPITELPCFALTLGVSPTGAGEITGNVGATPIACPPNCVYPDIPNNQAASLVAAPIPATGATFTSWTGCPTPPVGSACMAPMTASRNITANFILPSPGGGNPTTPPTVTPPAATPKKKCKKGRKLRRGRCVKKKKKKR